MRRRRAAGARDGELILPILLQALLALSAAGALAEDYALPPPPEASTTTTYLHYSADHLDYDAETAMLHLKGNVRVVESTRTIKGEELWVDMDSKTGRSEGHLFVEDGLSAISSESGEFDFGDGSARLIKTKAGYGDWRIHAKKARLAPGRKLNYMGARFTSCEFVPPHYHFYSTRLTVVPKKYMLARNVVFFLGPVPFFYSPFIYKSLKDKHLFRWRVQPGYDGLNGAFAKGTLFNQYGPHTYSKVYADYFSKRGWGTGLEIERNKGDDRGMLFGYRVEESSGAKRWTILGSLYQSFTPRLSSQARLQVQSDSNVNNEYIRSNLLRVTPELINSGALVYNFSRATTRLSYSRQDIYRFERGKDRYVRETETSPRLDVASAQLQFWRIPLLNTFSGFADKTYSRSLGYSVRTFGTGWEATQRYRLARGLIFTPKVGFSETYVDNLRAAAGHYEGRYFGRYRTENNLRWANLLGDWDLTQSYQMRLKPNMITEDASAADHGVEQNMLALRDAFRPTPKVLVRVFSAYDFRVFRTHMVGFRDRVQPIVSEVSYTPKPTLNFSLRDDYQLEQGNRSFLGSALWGDEMGSYISAATGYSVAVSSRYTLDPSFAIANSSKTWRFGVGLRMEAYSAGSIFKLLGRTIYAFEKEVFLAYALHDFFTRFLIRFRPLGVREFSVRIDLKFGAKATTRDSAPRRDWESEWFPERATGVHDRP